MILEVLERSNNYPVNIIILHLISFRMLVYVEYLYKEVTFFVPVMQLTNGRYRILIHLEMRKDSLVFDEHEKVPYSICQNGIAEAVNLSRSRTSEIIRDMVDDDLVEEQVRRVAGLKRRRKVYTLTQKGVKKAEDIRDKLKDKTVVVRRESNEYEVDLEKINSCIDSREPLLIALNNVDDNNVIDLRSKKKMKEDVFVGRNDEIKTLMRTFNRVKDGESQTVLIKGKAGIGKTRLVNEFITKTISEEVDFIHGKAYYESLEPYLPFKEAFKQCVSKNDYRPLQFSEGDNGSESSSNYDVRSGNERDLIFSETTENIRSLAEKKPLVIFIDDIQWADKATLILFHYLAEKLKDTSILLIGAYRPEDIGSDDFPTEVIQRMRREYLFEEIELESLKLEDTKEIIQSLIDRLDIPEDFVQMIYDTSEGNPLFMEEFVRQMLDDEIVDPKNNKFPCKTDEIDLPKVVNDIISRRMNILSKENLRVLQIGSIIGEDIPFSLLQSVSDMDSFDLLEYVDTLTGAGIWESQQDEDLFSFTHGLIQLTVYESIPEHVRNMLHEKVAQSMVELYQEDLKDHYSDIGYHYRKAGEYSQGLNYYLKAGERAEEVYAYEDSVEMYKEALSLSDEEDENRWEIYERLGDVHRVMGKYDQSEKYYGKIDKDSVEKKTQQRIFRKEAQVYESEGQFDKALEKIKEGSSDRFEENIETCRLYNLEGLAEIRQGKYDSAEKVLTKALKVCKEYGGDQEYSDISIGLGNVHLYKGETDDAIEHLKESLKTFERIDNTRGKSTALNSLGIVYLNKGELDKSLDYYKRSLEIRRKRKEKRDIFSTLNNMATIYLKKGNLEKAFNDYKESLEAWEEMGDKQGIAISLINLGEYHIKKGELKKALEKQEESLEICKEINFKKGQAASLSNLGAIYLLRNKIEKARKSYRECQQICEKIGYRSLLPDPIRGQALILLRKGRLEKALKKAKHALEISEEIEARVEEGISCRVLGRIYRNMDDQERAKEEFEKSEEILGEAGEKPEYAKLIYHYSLLLKDMGEKERYEEYLNNSYSMFKEMEMDPWINRIENRLDVKMYDQKR